MPVVQALFCNTGQRSKRRRGGMHRGAASGEWDRGGFSAALALPSPRPLLGMGSMRYISGGPRDAEPRRVAGVCEEEEPEGGVPAWGWGWG